MRKYAFNFLLFLTFSPLILPSYTVLAQEHKKIKLERIRFNQNCFFNDIVIPEGWILTACLDESTLLTPIEYNYSWDILNPYRRFRFLVHDALGNIHFAQEDALGEITVPSEPSSGEYFSNIFDPALNAVLETGSTNVNRFSYRHSTQGNQNKFSIRLRFDSHSQDNSYWSEYDQETLINSETMEVFPLASNVVIMLLSRCNQDLYDTLFSAYENLSDQLNALEIQRYQFYLEHGYFQGPVAYGEQEQAYWDWYFMTENQLNDQIEQLLISIEDIREDMDAIECGSLGYS